tara:strand:- start:8686 stop:9690 length:1005 start_codon:yes stop_codon:yes gene_type:complete
VKRDVWHELLDYETYDLVARAYAMRHGRKANKRLILSITSNFNQAREFFLSAEKAALSVRPLLLYYGVLCLSRALVLMLTRGGSEAAMKPSHGLATQKWKETIADQNMKNIGDLKVEMCSGTLNELILAIENKSYLKHATSGVNYCQGYSVPRIGETIKFSNLLATFPNLAREYEAWAGGGIPTYVITKLDVKPESCCVYVKKGKASKECLVNAFVTEEVLENRDSYMLTMKHENIFLTQLFDGSFGNIGDVCIAKPISANCKLALLPSFYCVSYYLGMLVRYFPSVWMSLSSVKTGDAIFPLLSQLLCLIHDQYPVLILEFLNSPYEFENGKN